MPDECLICKAPLEYLLEDVKMECAICHKRELSRARCVNGHYVCDECHTSGMDSIFALCQKETSRDPIEILERMMDLPFCHMHGPEHHVIAGAALLTAYRNAGGRVPFDRALLQIYRRGKEVPGGTCGFWGACGACISAGIFVSVVTEASPLSGESWGLANAMTSRALARVAEIGGPRCCKRNSYLALREAVAFAAEKLGVRMDCHMPVCTRSAQNQQCIGRRCPFCAAGK